MQIPPQFKPGNWHEGKAVDLAIYTDGRDSYPNDFTCYVAVRDRATQAITNLKGKGSFVGNFSPIFVTWKGQRMLVTELLNWQPKSTAPETPDPTSAP